MPNQIEAYFFERPERITGAGNLLILLTCWMMLAAAIGKFIATAANTFPRLLDGEPAKALADIFPSLPLWWVPETAVGIIVALAILAGGCWVRSFGKRVEVMCR